MLRQIEWKVQNGPIRKNGVLPVPVTISIFLKILFKSSYKELTWFDVLISQISVFILFVSAGVVFDGAFSLWVSLNKLAKNSVYSYY